MNKAKKTKTKRIIFGVCALVLVAVLAAMPLFVKNEEAEDGPQASILSDEAGKNTVQTTLFGSGTLTEEEAVTVTVPEAVRLTGWLVKNGDTVTKGQPLASVDRVSVMEALSLVQESLDYLAEQIQEESSSTTSSKVAAKAGGTVKVVYAQVGDHVRDVMLEHGALAVLSLDGLMSVSLETDSTLSTGTTVTVTLADGTAVSGRVDSNLAGTMVVTVEDQNYEAGQTVEVRAEDALIGSGELVIRSPWKATAYTGTVKTVAVTGGSAVSAGQTLMTLADTGSTATWQQLVDQRKEYEELQLELFTLYQTGSLSAPCDGVVSGVDEESDQMMAVSLILLANAPNGDDETGYTSFVGKVAAVGGNGWAMSMDPREMNVLDFKQLSQLPVEESAMTELVIYDPTPASGAPVPIYELAEDAWVPVDAGSVSAGDVLLFAADSTGDFVWIIRVSKGSTQSGGSTQPSDPTQPGGSMGGGSFPSGGTYPSFGGSGTQEEEEFTLYGLTTVTVASVTPQDIVTVEITVDELDILKLQTGQSARITLDALGGAGFDAVISAIGNVGTSNGGSSKFTVELTLSRGEDMLGGMNATVAISLDSSEALTVPVAALVENGTQTVVYTGYDEKEGILTDPVAVETGASDGENVVILSGLAEGDTFYYAYYDTLEISNLPDFGSGFSFGR